MSNEINDTLIEHIVLVGHHKRFVWLMVDNSENIITGRTPKYYKFLNVSPYLFVGGHETFTQHPFTQHPFLKLLRGFKGELLSTFVKIAFL